MEKKPESKIDSKTVPTAKPVLGYSELPTTTVSLGSKYIQSQILTHFKAHPEFRYQTSVSLNSVIKQITCKQFSDNLWALKQKKILSSPQRGFYELSVDLSEVNSSDKSAD